MALYFGGASSHRVDCGSGTATASVNLTTGTMIAWVYMNSVADGRFAARGLFGTSDPSWWASGVNQVDVFINRATAGLNVNATSANLPGFGSGKWSLIAATWNTGGVDADQHLYSGDLTTLADEASAYATRTVGSGTVSNNSSRPLILGNAANNALALPGRLHTIQFYNRQLSLAEIRSWQFQPRNLTGCVGHWRLGDSGTGTQRDLSGNRNNGTVTGATLANNPPLPRWRRRGAIYVPASAAPTEISGTVTGTLSLGGSATATVPVTATASGSLSLGGSATASVGDPPVTASASGSLSLAGSATALVAVTALISGSLAIAGTASAAVGPTVTVDTGTTYQVMSGWEATAQIGQTDVTSYPWATETLDLAVNQLGLNRIRLEVYAGVENDADYFLQYYNGEIDTATWNSKKFSPVNDDGDPDTVNASGFHFGRIDLDVSVVVNPMRALLAARGESLYVNLCYVAFSTTTGHLHEDVDEYAELILATFQHLDSTYGWVPDAVEVILEPDNGTFFDSGGGTLIGQAIAATGAKLDAAGYTGVEFIAPSTESMANADDYFDAIWAVTAARPYLKEISYHRYLGVSDTNLGNIKTRATANDLRSAMLEHIGSGVEALYKDILLGHASAWQQFTIAYPNATDNGGKYFPIVSNSPTWGSRTHALALYFRHVRRGAVRVGATSADANVRPVAFQNPWGGVVTVLHCDAAGDYIVEGLPAGRYDVTRATATADASDLGEITVGGDGRAYLSVPDASIVAIAPLGEAFVLGSLSISGAATASVAVTASVSGSLSLGGSAAGEVTSSDVSAAVTGSLALSGTATATVAVQASASGTLAIAGSAAATVPVTASVSGALALAGAATGEIPVTATVTGTLSLSGSGTAVVGNPPVTASVSGSLGITGSASVTVPVTGQVAGALAITGNAVGAVEVSAAVAGTVTLAGSVTGTVPVTVTVTGSLGLAGTGTATVPVVGAITGSLGLTGSATVTTAVAILESFTMTVLTAPRYRMEIATAPRYTMDLGGPA